MTIKSESTESGKKESGGKHRTPRVRWNTQNLKSSYANVCTMTSTREEVVLSFGVNQTWERNAEEMEIELNDRIILSPFSAMRMLESLQRLMTEYQQRYGELQTQPLPTPSMNGPETKQ